jgi:hypothetical protein
MGKATPGPEPSAMFRITLGNSVGAKKKQSDYLSLCFFVNRTMLYSCSLNTDLRILMGVSIPF